MGSHEGPVGGSGGGGFVFGLWVLCMEGNRGAMAVFTMVCLFVGWLLRPR